ncbi:MAG TPA: hypothetical protein VGM78_10710 [Ilumatobacteraceae bacterium]|jgi:hypothetical protein
MNTWFGWIQARSVGARSPGAIDGQRLVNDLNALATELEAKGWEIASVQAVIGGDQESAVTPVSATLGFVVLAKAMQR